MSTAPFQPGHSVNCSALLDLSSRHRYFLYRPATDMRKSFDGLSGLVRSGLGMDPASGDVYVFLNRRRDRLKLLLWQGDGFALYYKRLERGTFEYPKTEGNTLSHPLQWPELLLILQGIQLKNIQYRRRYQRA